jgi:hypothetical protein
MTATPQHMTALAEANACRKARSSLRHQVHDTRSLSGGCGELAEVLADGAPSCMASMRVEEALRWLWHHGRSIDRFIDETLELVGCSEWKLVGDLTVRQRSILVNVLRYEAGGMRMAA